jgi:hypothetical protein
MGLQFGKEYDNLMSGVENMIQGIGNIVVG